MPLSGLVLAMLPGMLPLLLYVLVAELFGDGPGIIAGIALGLAEFLWIRLRTRRTDWFVLLDTALLVGTGAVTFLLDDLVFFHLKPVILEALLVILIGYSAFGPRNLVMDMAFRGTKAQEVKKVLDANKQAQAAMTGRLKGLTIILAAHTLAVLSAALGGTREVWAFLSGPALYLLLGIWFVVLLAMARFRRSRPAATDPAHPAANDQGCEDSD